MSHSASPPDHTVPQTILQALHDSPVEGYPNGKYAMMSWGIEKITGSEESDSYGQGWIRLKVTGGTKFKGLIRISLDYNNNYGIIFELYHNKTGEFTTFHRMENVPADKLGSALDHVIEGPLASEREKP